MVKVALLFFWKGILKTGVYEWVYQWQCFSSLWCAMVDSNMYDCCIFFWGGGCFKNTVRYESYEHGFGLFLYHI